MQLGMLTPEEAGHKLRELAELTASASQNWDAFEEIASSIIRQAFEHGKTEKQEPA